jgi:hypothetical protein
MKEFLRKKVVNFTSYCNYACKTQLYVKENLKTNICIRHFRIFELCFIYCKKLNAYKAKYMDSI